MLSEGRIGAYLKYAIGEIVLVVIGILIALQINNWNEWKKERKKEEKILTQVKNNITESIAIWEEVVSISEGLCKNYEVVLACRQDNLPYHDSLKIHFNRASWIAYNWTTGHSTSSFEALKNMGFDIIRNDSLTDIIIDVFDRHILRVQNQYQTEESNSAHKEYITTRIQDLIADFESNDYTSLLEDNYYYSILRVRNNFREFHISKFENQHLPAMREAVKLIDEELDKIR